MVKYLKGIFLLGCFYFNSENYGSVVNMLDALLKNQQNKEGCCKELFCCGDPFLSVSVWTPIIGLGGTLIGVIVKAILQTRFKRLIGKRIRARKKDVKKYKQAAKDAETKHNKQNINSFIDGNIQK